MNPEEFSRRVLAWFDRHGRKDLPWKTDPSPYRVWVSEIMLQQTQVNTVVPYYRRFLARFPDVIALARADLDEVLHLWSGLGYYARARNLHRAAVIVRDRYGGELPGDVEALRALPGIGRSTAGAILALARNERQPILDGNVKRVLARFAAVEGWPGQGRTLEELWALAERYTPHERVSDYTQAMMDLGAMVCTRHRPHCRLCPLAAGCAAHAQGRETSYPAPRPRRELPVRRTCMLLLHTPNGEVLLEKRPPSGIWGGLWSLPECPPETDVARWCRDRLGVEVGELQPWAELRHTFSHFHLDATPVRAAVRATPGAVMEAGRYVWYNVAQPDERGLAAPVGRLLAMLANDFWKQSLQINHLNPPEGGISHSVHTVIDAMPTIRKLSSGSYNVQIRRNGVPPISKTFKTKNDALAWARKTETDLDRGLFVDTRIAERITLDEVIDRYIDEILPSKKAIKSVKSYSKHVKKALGKYSLNRLTAAMISEYRDLRLKDNVYSNQTVVHELNLISRVLNACMKDWNIQLPNGNVVKNVRYPKLPNGRNRRITKSEECILCQELPTKILPLFKLALETGMRRGELVNIEWKHVDLDNRTLFIPLTKTDIPRTIPLSPTALKVFESVRLKGEGKVFNIGAEWITKSFAMTCHKIGIEDLHWHDLRHEAITRLFEKGLNVMEVSAISGHQDLRMLKRYVHLDASILARKLQ